MKIILFFFSFLTLSLKASSITCPPTDQTCLKYLKVWQELLMKKSSMDQAYFDTHIKILEAKEQKWDQGVSLEIQYELVLDWVKIKRYDQIITFINPSAPPYPALNVPLGKALEADQILRADSKAAWATSIGSIPKIDKLKFSSQAEALEALRNRPDGKNLKANEVNFNRPGMLPRDNGHPHLHATGNISVDTCVKGMIDLVTGEAHVHRDACRIYIKSR
jgi:hypothetical protein